MKFSKLDLLTLLISLFLFSSCKDSNSIGLDLDPENAVSGTLVDTVTVTTRTVADEATQTFFAPGAIANPDRYPLGVLKDPVFGTTTASLAMSVNLPSGSYNFSKANPTIDSAVLVLSYSTDSVLVRRREFYGDSTTTFNISVSQLTENLAVQPNWPSNKTYASGDILGTFTGKAKPNTKLKVTTIIADGPDSVITVRPQLRIKLDAAMIKNKIIDLDSLTTSSNARFNVSFKGLKVSATTTGTGAMMFLNFASNESNLELYYKQQNATDAALIDTIQLKLPITTATNPVAATVVHDHSNTPVATQLNTPAEYQITYLQAMGGVRNKIAFPFLKQLKADLGAKIIINKAELVIDSSNPADSIPFKIPPRLSLYRLDIAGQRVNLADNNVYDRTNNPSGDPRIISPRAFDGYYRFIKQGYSENSYVFNLTNHIQDLIDGKIVDYGTFLAPISSTATSTTLQAYAFPAPTSAGRVVIGSFNNADNRKRR